MVCVPSKPTGAHQTLWANACLLCLKQLLFTFPFVLPGVGVVCDCFWVLTVTANGAGGQSSALHLALPTSFSSCIIKRKSIGIHTVHVYDVMKSLKSSKRLWYLTLVLTQICLFCCLYGECKNSCLDIRLNRMFLGVFKLNAIFKPPVHKYFVSFL